MAKLLPQRELRNNNAKVIDAVVAGETFIVTRNGEQVAELRPLVRARLTTLVPRSEIAAVARRAPALDHKRFRADLERVLDQQLRGRPAG